MIAFVIITSCQKNYPTTYISNVIKDDYNSSCNNNYQSISIDISNLFKTNYFRHLQ